MILMNAVKWDGGKVTSSPQNLAGLTNWVVCARRHKWIVIGHRKRILDTKGFNKNILKRNDTARSERLKKKSAWVSVKIEVPIQWSVRLQANPRLSYSDLWFGYHMALPQLHLGILLNFRYVDMRWFGGRNLHSGVYNKFRTNAPSTTFSALPYGNTQAGDYHCQF